MKVVKRKISELIPADYNPRKLSPKQENDLKNSLQEFGLVDPIIINVNVDRKNVIIGGHQRLKVWQKLGNKEIDCVEVDLSLEKERELNVRLNKNTGEFDFDILLSEFEFDDLVDWGFEDFELDIFEDEKEHVKFLPKKLSDRFVIPPFSVLNTQLGIWQHRKNYWLSLGIKSEIGRDSMALNFSSNIKDSSVVSGEGLKWSESTKDMVAKIAGNSNGVSIFDPVLCELSYKWFNVPNGKILDCFAGGSVRGIVAAKLGYEYLGNDLRSKQIDANRINAKEVLKDAEIYPTWTCGDSLHIDKLADGYEADLLFSCPPYADLEVYSDAKEDISNMPYNDFLSVYREIIRKSCQLLKNDRFAVFVVGDVRDKKGLYQNFVSDTIDCFLDCGLFLYNEMILLNSIGNAGMRAAKTFNGGRKVIKVHQNVLVFYKGDPKIIKENYPIIDVSYLDDIIENE